MAGKISCSQPTQSANRTHSEGSALQNIRDQIAKAVKASVQMPAGCSGRFGRDIRIADEADDN